MHMCIENFQEMSVQNIYYTWLFRASCFTLSYTFLLLVLAHQFLQFLESLSKTLSMDRVTGDMGIDGATVAILARAEQVMKNESSNLVDRKTQIYNLQRQIKTLKDQADSKVRVHTNT